MNNKMNTDSLHVLLIESQPRFADTVQKILTTNSDRLFAVEWLDALQPGIERLHQGEIDVTLLDLSLVDSQGLETVASIRAQLPDMPIVVAGDLDDETIAVDVIRQGAQDYLCKEKTEPAFLIRTLQCAIARKQADRRFKKQPQAALLHHTERLKISQEINRAILTAQSPEETATIALGHLRHLISFHRASITLFDFEADQTTVLAADNIDDDNRLRPGKCMPLDAPQITTMRQGQHYVVHDLLTVPVLSDIDELLLAEGVRSTAHIPLISQNKLIGSLNLGDITANTFSEERLKVAREVADQIAIAVQQAQLLMTSQRRAQESEIMASISKTLNETLDLNRVLQLIADSARQIIPQAKGTVIHLLDEDSQVLQPVTVTETGRLYVDQSGMGMGIGKGVAGTVVKEGNLINVGDTLNDPRYLRSHQASHRSLLVVPIQSQMDIVGTITVQSSIPHAFSSADERALSTLGTQAALALQNARLFDAERQARYVAETLQAANQALTQSLDLDNVLGTLLEYIAHLVPYDSAHVMLVEENDTVTIRASRVQGYGASDMNRVRSMVFSKKHATLHPIFSDRQSVLIPDTREFPGWILQEESEYVRSWLGVPLLIGNEVIGLYAMNMAEVGFFTPTHQRMAEMLAAQAAIAVQNALLYQAEREQLRRLQESQTQLIQAEKMGALGQLVASIAHEVNNPIQAMTGCLTLTTEALDSGQSREKVDLYLGIIKSELDRVASIVRNLRDFYQPGQDEMHPVDIYDILESMLMLTGKQLQQSDILVQRQWAKSLPNVLANSSYLKQVFLNLILNAIDAMPDGGTLYIKTGMDEVLLRNDTVLSPAVYVEISDTGMGMPPEITSRLFEPFFSTKDHGSGLGLSVSYGIIEAHRGEITVSSQVGVGTTFTILLPATLS